MVMKRLEQRWKRLNKETGDVVAKAAEFGKEFMQSIAPVDTGATFNAIKWTRGKATNGKNATIIIGEGTHAPDRTGKILGRYGLTYYMNFVAKKDVWTSGEPKFIKVGVKETKKRFGRDVRRVVNSFVKGDKF
jgi:hypothetical protein